MATAICSRPLSRSGRVATSGRGASTAPSPLAVVRRLWWPKIGTVAAERFEDLDLHAGVGDVILAAHDVRDADVDVVDHGRQRVEIGAVLAHAAPDRTARRVSTGSGPRTRSVQSTCGAGSLKRQCGLRPPLRARRARRPSASARRDRRPAARRVASCRLRGVELVLRLVAGIEPAGGLELLDRRVVAAKRADCARLVGSMPSQARSLDDRLVVFRSSAPDRCRRGAG